MFGKLTDYGVNYNVVKGSGTRSHKIEERVKESGARSQKTEESCGTAAHTSIDIQFLLPFPPAPGTYYA